jgi:two-component system, LytTR family, response regulator LytT
VTDGMRILVVDDDAPARDELTFLLRRIPDVGTVDEAGGGEECLAALARPVTYDAVFLDVRMPRLDGLALARRVTEMPAPPAIVFVTAFDEYAVEAFGLAAVDYLLKPVRPERVAMTVRRLRARGTRTEPGPGYLDDRLPVMAGGEILLLPVDEVRVATVDGDHVAVCTPAGRYPSRLTLTDFETRVAGRGFLRVHRQFVVNLHHVVSIGAFFNGTYLLTLAGLPDLAVPVSRRHAAELRTAVGI